MTADPDTPRWHLLRAALLKVGDPPREFNFGMSSENVKTITLHPVSFKGEPQGMLAVAAVPLGAIEIGGGALTLPDESRQEAERALELLCRFAALEFGTTHRIISTKPCLGIHCSDPWMLADLDGTQVHTPPHTSLHALGLADAGVIHDADLVTLLAERIDGVVLLTEALNAESPLGKFTQFWRLFERAFHTGHRGAAPLIAEFLRGGHNGFELGEVKAWADMRNPAIHADRRQVPTLDSDVQAFIERMREAAYDVLLNKASWSSATADRRSKPWRPATGSSSLSGDIFVVKGKGETARLEMHLLDEFDSFPLALFGPFEDSLPEACWLWSDDSGDALRRRGSGALDLK